MTPGTPQRELTHHPLTDVPASMHRQRDRKIRSSRRVECPSCGALKAPGAVVTHGDPEWSIRYESWIVHRSIYCAGCDHVMHWLEEASGPPSAAWRPTGVVLSGPGYSSGTDYIRRYLSAHPQAQEVEQV